MQTKIKEKGSMKENNVKEIKTKSRLEWKKKQSKKEKTKGR